MASTSVRNPSQNRAIRTRAALVAAAELEFSESGYAQTTARSIAARAGVATGTFYQYFGDKDVLLRELALVRQARIASESADILGVDLNSGDEVKSVLQRIEHSMSRVVQLVVDYHRENPGLHAVLTERRHADPELDALTAQAEALLVSRSAELLKRSGFVGDMDATAFVLFGMVEGSAHAHVLGKAMVSDERFTHALVAALIHVAFPGLQTLPLREQPLGDATQRQLVPARATTVCSQTVVAKNQRIEQRSSEHTGGLFREDPGALANASPRSS